VYRAESLVLIEGQRIPERYVAATVNDRLDNRLSMLAQEIKSYDILLDIIKQFNLYKQERAEMAQEEVIEKMREDISVDLVRGWGRDDFPAFTIAFLGPNPEMTARVANDITRRFLEKNLKLRGEQALATSEFLDSQLAEARRNLEKQEALLSEYRTQHQGELPEQADTLVAMLSRLELQLRGVQDSVKQNQQQKMILDSNLGNAESSLATFGELAKQMSRPTPGVATLAGPQKPSELDLARAKLEALRARYSPDHPDARRAAVELALLEAEQAKAEKENQSERAAKPEPTVDQERLALMTAQPTLAANLEEQKERVEGFKVQQVILEQERKALEANRGKVLGAIGGVEHRIANLPVREQELAKVIRDYDISKENYQSLLNKKMEADVAAEMETRQKAERFRLLDVARVPHKPVKPNRELFIAVGAVAGLMLGALLAFGLEWRHGVLLGEWELPEGTLVLGRVPPIRIAHGDVWGGPEKEVPKRGRGLTLKVRSKKRQLVLAPTILLCVIGAIVATTIYTGWSPF
jgi:uncharacterized protein involved in exopolysaccharide biosynthesis